MEPDHRVGDVVRISCPSTDARVTEVPRAHHPYVVVEWPWWSPDPDCDWIECNGQVALAGDPASCEWDGELFRTEPAARDLAVGATCRVGIPPTIVHVVSVEHFDPPRETGRLPRPHTYVVVLRAGLSYDAELEEQGAPSSSPAMRSPTPRAGLGVSTPLGTGGRSTDTSRTSRSGR